MLPLLPVGETVEIEPLREDLRPFDIVVFRAAGKIIVHYVVHANRLKEADPVFVTRGLANGGEDLPIRRSDVLGLVVSHRIPLRTRLLLLAARLLKRVRGF